MPHETAPASRESTVTAAAVAAVDADTLRAEHQRQRAEEIAAVKHWRNRIAAGRALDRDEHERWRRWREYAGGNRKKNWLVDTNLVGSTIEALLPFIYARDPEVAVTPEESVGAERYTGARLFADTLEQVISRQFRDAGLKPAMERVVVSAMTVSQGWVKLGWQIDSQRDPLIERRIADIQDNLARIDALQRDVEDQARTDTEIKREELRQQLTALQAQVEVAVSRGLVIDLIQAEDIQVDPGLRELADYAHAHWIAHRIWMTPDEAKMAFPTLTAEQLAMATVYNSRVDRESADGQTPARPAAVDEGCAWLAVWEVWDKRTSVVRTLIEGVEVWARPPYPPDPVGRRFYPFHMLAFHFVDGARQPIADVEWWHKLQDEYARSRSQWAEHRKRAIPARIGDKDSITPADARKVANPENNELVLVERQNKGEPISNLVSIMPQPQVDGALYTTDPLRQDLELVSGLQDANRGAVITAKTATEAQILQQGTLSRVSKRLDAVERVIEGMAQHAAELALQVLPLDEVRRIAGPRAVWPQMAKDELYSLVSIRIRAGTSGRPNTAVERETWVQLLPILKQSILEIVQLRQQGQHGLAQAATELLRETLRRADERLDLDRFLPPIEPTPAPAAAMPGQIDAGLPHDVALPVPAADTAQPTAPPLIQ